MKLFTNKDCYDLDAALQIAGLSEKDAKELCCLIDIDGRAPLIARKSIAQVFLRQKIDKNTFNTIYENVPHIFKQNIKYQLASTDFKQFKQSIKCF